MTLATPLTPPPDGLSFLLPGRRRLSLVAEIGRGEVAKVYRAVVESDAFVRRLVAVKMYEATFGDEPDATLLALGRLAQSAVHVQHPNAVALYELAVIDATRAALLMELVEGTTLERLSRHHAAAGHKLPLDLALFICTEVAEALSGARMATTPEGILAGMPHLDVAAHQVLLSLHGEVKLSDFGLAQIARMAAPRGSSVRPLRPSGARWGSVAPEIACGRPGDTRSDVFSLAILLRDMLVGPRFGPDVGEDEALEQARAGHVPPTFLELQLPPDVRAILGHALEVDPARRFPHAASMAYELRRVALSMGVGDARMFLRASIAAMLSGYALEDAPISGDLFEPRKTDPVGAFGPDEPTQELELDLEDMTAPRVPADRTSGLILKAERLPRGKRDSAGDD
jgi:serine/threonine protein kinase